ncbi:Flagellar L-ring protein FlgH [Chitinispirillum alkaliphilum]|nr:Flagellar L-ring protein FlgH [Chitinispirillum alkaliphilum]
MKRSGVKFLFGFVFVITFSAQSSNIHSLFSDHRAMRVDDILTVMIVESAKAGSESRTNTNKQNSFGVEGMGGSGSLGFLPSFGANGGTHSKYDGRGGTSREGKLVATVSTRIVRVMDNGNLVIDGSKVVEINNEKEIIKVSGIVRPQDVQKNNIIYSSSIADANITYTGMGVVNTAQRPGFFTRLINWIF